jgi:heme-degrading monooxygenase HmoA
VIARIWRGATASADADQYLEYLEQTGLSEYRKTGGNRAVVAMRRIVDDRAEFLLLTLWDSVDSIRAFAGQDIDRAVFYQEDERFLVERGEQVDHFDVVFSKGAL